jgi:hypothetical protein
MMMSFLLAVNVPYDVGEGSRCKVSPACTIEVSCACCMVVKFAGIPVLFMRQIFADTSKFEKAVKDNAISKILFIT